jgi:diaminopimelate decarboxylase/aspartate kinase
LLVRPVRSDAVLGPNWEQLHSIGKPSEAPATAWWQHKRTALLQAFGDRNSAFVYDRATITARAAALRSLKSVSRVLYAMKANPAPGILQLIADAGLGLECVSLGEVERALSVPGMSRDRILFTPNFAPREEYVWALANNIRLTIDNLYALRAWPDLLGGREIFVRIDPGQGRGHHQHVRTGGAYSKFGIPAEEHDALVQLASELNLRITGLHAHVGSGVFDVGSWADTAQQLGDLSRRLTDVRVIDVGGGLGVPDREGRSSFDLAALTKVRDSLRGAGAAVDLWLEPGRFLVAESGVLLARVTQTKSKGDVHYVGIATGMNSLIRPALYGAHHDIVNLSRISEPATETVNVVGPICESADYLGHDRLLPASVEGDVLLIATAGAYGRAMSSTTTCARRPKNSSSEVAALAVGAMPPREFIDDLF